MKPYYGHVLMLWLWMHWPSNTKCQDCEADSTKPFDEASNETLGKDGKQMAASWRLISSHDLSCLYFILASHRFPSLRTSHSSLSPQQFPRGKPKFNWGYYGKEHKLYDAYQTRSGHLDMNLNRDAFLDYKSHSFTNSFVPYECLPDSSDTDSPWVIKSVLVPLSTPYEILCHSCKKEDDINGYIKSFWILLDRDISHVPSKISFIPAKNSNPNTIRVSEYVYTHWTNKKLLSHMGRENRGRFANLAERFVDDHIADKTSIKPDSRLWINPDPSNIHEFIQTFNGLTFLCAQSPPGRTDIESLDVLTNVDTLISFKQYMHIRKILILNINRANLVKTDPFTYPFNVTLESLLTRIPNIHTENPREFRLYLDQLSEEKDFLSEKQFTKLNLKIALDWGAWSCCSGCCEKSEACIATKSFRRRDQLCVLKKINGSEPLRSPNWSNSINVNFPDPVHFHDQKITCDHWCQWLKLDLYLSTEPYLSHGIACYSSLLYFTFPVVWHYVLLKTDTLKSLNEEDKLGWHRQVEACTSNLMKCKDWERCGNCANSDECEAIKQGLITGADPPLYVDHVDTPDEEVERLWHTASVIVLKDTIQTTSIELNKNYAVYLEIKKGLAYVVVEWFNGATAFDDYKVITWHEDMIDDVPKMFVFEYDLMLLQLTEKDVAKPFIGRALVNGIAIIERKLYLNFLVATDQPFHFDFTERLYLILCGVLIAFLIVSLIAFGCYVYCHRSKEDEFSITAQKEQSENSVDAEVSNDGEDGSESFTGRDDESNLSERGGWRGRGSPPFRGRPSARMFKGGRRGFPDRGSESISDDSTRDSSENGIRGSSATEETSTDETISQDLETSDSETNSESQINSASEEKSESGQNSESNSESSKRGSVGGLGPTRGGLLRGGPSSRRGGPSSRRGGPSSRRGGPSSRRGGPSSRRGGPTIQVRGPSIKLSRPSLRLVGPPNIRLSGAGVRLHGSSIRLSRPSIRVGLPGIRLTRPGIRLAGPSIGLAGPQRRGLSGASGGAPPKKHGGGSSSSH